MRMPDEAKTIATGNGVYCFTIGLNRAAIILLA
jgi:hypothetical protein